MEGVVRVGQGGKVSSHGVEDGRGHSWAVG